MPPYMCESEMGHYAGHDVPYSLRRACGFFNVPEIYYMCKGLCDGAYGFSSLSEKTKKFILDTDTSNHGIVGWGRASCCVCQPNID